MADVERVNPAALAALQRVVSHPPEKWYLVARNLREHGAEVAMTLIVEARACWRDDLERARHAASAAVAAVEREAEQCPRAAIVAALAHAVEGNVARLDGRLSDAELSLHTATAWLELAAWAPAAIGEVAKYTGSLERARRNFPDAINLLCTAAFAYDTEERRSDVLRCRVAIAFCFGESGDRATAAAILRRVLPELRDTDGDLYTTALHNLAVCYACLGEGRKARGLLPEIRERLYAGGHWADLLRLEWLEGLTCLAEGNPVCAEGAFLEVQDGFLHARRWFDAALVSLDLAALYLDEGQIDKAAGMAAELVPVFRNLGIERETVAAGLVLLHSLEKKCATAQAVRAFADRLRLAKLV